MEEEDYWNKSDAKAFSFDEDERVTNMYNYNTNNVIPKLCRAQS